MVKRSAEEQISEHTDFEALEEESGPSGTWEKAAPEVLAARKIRKIKRPTTGAAVATGEVAENVADRKEERQGGAKASNPFSSVSLVAPTSTGAPATQSLRPIVTNINDQESGSPQKSAHSVSSGGLSISIPSPSVGATQGKGSNSNISCDRFGNSSPSSGGRMHQLTPGSFTPGGGRKANPFSGSSPHASTNPFASVQDDGNKNNDMWTKLSSSHKAQPGSAGMKGNPASAGVVPWGGVVPSVAEGGAGDGTTPTVSSAGSGDGVIEEDILQKITKRKKEMERSKDQDKGTGQGGTASAPAPAPTAVVSNPFMTAATGTGPGSSGHGLAIKSGASATNAISSTFPSVPGSAGPFSSSVSSISAKVTPFSVAASGSSSVFGKDKSSGGSLLSTIGSTKVEAIFGTSTTSSSSNDDGTLKGTAPGGEAGHAGADAEAEGDSPEQAAALEAQAELSTEHAVYGKTYAMTGGPILTGEESETCLLQVRAKLFKLVTKLPEKPDSDDDAADTKSRDKRSPESAPAKEWSEVGVGPLRVLKAKESGSDTSSSSSNNGARIVMRREDKKGGLGTKVILNAKIKTHSSAMLQGEKSLCFCTFVPSTDGGAPNCSSSGGVTDTVVPVSYMLRCKLASETSDLHKVITAAIAQAKGDAATKGE